MTTKTAVVTGANSGIGLETARGLVERGYRTMLLCRNAERAAAAQADIGGSSEVVLGDLGSLASVRAAAASVRDRLDRLDLLVNNAGVTLRTREVNADGNDVMLATNHLGPLLLTEELRPLLESSGPGVRVVNLASDAHKFSPLHLDDIQATRGYGFLGFPRYGETKLMNILTTRQQARRYAGTGVTYNCVHPGAVSTNLGAPPKILAKLIGLFMKSPEQGARTSLAAATDPAFATENGTYFVNGKPANQKLNKHAQNDDDGAELWDLSMELLGG